MAGDASAELMDRIYRRQRHLYDLSRKYYLLGRDRLIEDLAPAPGSRILEIGCGTGRNLIAAARYYPEVLLFGIDVSAEMLLTARRNVERSGLASRICLALGDATRLDTAIPFAEGSFSRIFLSYSLSMIPDWRAALDGAFGRLPPGGELHIVDFGGQAGLPAWFRVGLRAWLKLHHVTPRDDLEAALTDCTRQRCALRRFERPYRGYVQHAVAAVLPSTPFTPSASA